METQAKVLTDNLIYEKKVLIRSEQVDMTRKLRMSELFRLMEEASIAHTEALGCTRDKTLDRGLLWIITRQQAEIEEMPAYDEEITVRSWQGDMMHVFFPRFYEIERAGRIIIRGQALWMLIEEESRQMVMPEDYDISIPGKPGSSDMMLAPVRMPEEQCVIAEKELVTRFSQMDINGHMNNTRYFDIIDDMLFELGRTGDRSAEVISPDAETDTAHSGKAVPAVVRANYLSELRAGDRFTVRCFEDTEGRLFFEGSDDEKIKFRIEQELRG